MRSNIKLGKISGIEIGLHYSWFIIAALIVFSLGERFHQMNPNWSSRQNWVAALVTAVLFFVSLLLHELAHSLVAQSRGLKVKAITLFALGGVSQIQDDATDPKTEFWPPKLSKRLTPARSELWSGPRWEASLAC